MYMSVTGSSGRRVRVKCEKVMNVFVRINPTSMTVSESTGLEI